MGTSPKFHNFAKLDCRFYRAEYNLIVTRDKSKFSRITHYVDIQPSDE